MLDDLKKRYGGDFWPESNYDVKEMLRTNFSSKKGWDYLMVQESMFEYYAKLAKGKRTVLEIGVGTGVHLLAFDRMGFTVTGIEPDPLNARLVNEKLKHGKCHNGFFEDFEFDERFDLIFLYHVMEHLTDPRKTLERCSKLLSDDGLVIIAVPDCGNPDTLDLSVKNPYHLWHFSKRSMKRLAEGLDCYSVVKTDSFSELPKTQRRLHKVLKKANMASLSKRFLPLLSAGPHIGQRRV